VHSKCQQRAFPGKVAPIGLRFATRGDLLPRTPGSELRQSQGPRWRQCVKVEGVTVSTTASGMSKGATARLLALSFRTLAAH
jgi:hypothetical protein